MPLPVPEVLPLAWIPGPTEWIIIGVLGLLFFGKRLPEVGKSLGRGIVEFRKGLKGVEDDIETASDPKRPAPASPSTATTVATPYTATPPQPRFDPYTGKPLQPAFDPYTGKPLTDSNPTTK